MQVSNTKKRIVLVVGATSSIAQACCHEFARQGHDLFLASRDLRGLMALAHDLRVRYQIQVNYALFDAVDLNQQKKLFQQVVALTPQLYGVLCAVGYLGDHTATAVDASEQQRIVSINFTGLIPLLDWSAQHITDGGFLTVISSVAGDRGRKNNYLYGAAKAGLNTYLAGLRHHYAQKNINITTIKPGFVDTAMTYGLVNSRLMIAPARAAQHICRAIALRRRVVYVPAVWRFIMWLIRAIPEPLFKRMNI